MNRDGTEYEVQKASALRIKLTARNSKVYVTLISGLAEIFGAVLVAHIKYELSTDSSVFTNEGCVVKVVGEAISIHTSKEMPMMQYKECHAALEEMRFAAERNETRGPVALVVGRKDVGKSTLCRILINYAARVGRKPLYAELDVGQGSISPPGTISTLLVEQPVDVEKGYSQAEPLTYHFGHKNPNDNNILYKRIISNMAAATRREMESKVRTKYSGIIINTCGWVDGGGYGHLMHVANAFEVDKIFVINDPFLRNKLLRSTKSSVEVLSLPKSSGAVQRSKLQRNESLDSQIREYFYGFRKQLRPYSIELNFKDMKLYNIVNMQKKNTQLVAVTPGPWLMHHLLSVSSAKSQDEEVLAKTLDGIVCVTAVNEELQIITIISPQPPPLPNGLLIVSNVEFFN